MSNILKELKAEITRLARKEVKTELAQVKKVNATQRGLIAGLRRQVDALQKELSVLKKVAPKTEKVLGSKTEPEGRFWITAKGVKALRKRLGLTQAVFGKLVEVSMPTVVNWEKAEGKIDIRKKATMARLQQIKGMGKKEVAAMLGEETAAKKVKATKKAKASKTPKKARKTKGPKASKAPKKAKTPKAPKKAKAPKVSKKSKAPKKAKAPKTPKAPKALEKVEEKPVETPAEAKKD